MVELVHAVATMRQTHRAGQVVVDGVFSRRGELAVQRCRILLQLQDAPARREGGQIPGGVPGGAGGELVALEEQGVLDTQSSKMVKAAAPHHTTTNHDNPRMFCHVLTLRRLFHTKAEGQTDTVLTLSCQSTPDFLDCRQEIKKTRDFFTLE